MRITIDAVPLLYRSAGVKNYLYYWTRALRREGAPAEILLFPFLSEPERLDHESPAAGPAGAFARLGLMFLLNRIPLDLARWVGPRSDIFHACKLRYPPRGPRLTATVHDVTWRTMPELHLRANVAAEEDFAERVLKRARGLIAASEATRIDVIRELRLPPEKIRTIYHGVADAFFAAGPAEAERARGRHRLERPYALFLGTIEPRKNVNLLLNVWASLPASIRGEFDLLVAGPSGWRQKDTLARLAAPPPGVRRLGYVPEEDLPGLVSGAAVLVYPSLYEGFGFPVAQAMAAGAPVVTSAVSSLPEIGGDAAVLVDPRSEADLRQALLTVLTSPARREEMSRLGRIVARRFSWEECARQSLRFFREIA